MGRFLAALFLCALLLMGSALMKEGAQPVFFSLLFEQLLPFFRLANAGFKAVCFHIHLHKLPQHIQLHNSSSISI